MLFFMLVSGHDDLPLCHPKHCSGHFVLGLSDS